MFRERKRSNSCHEGRRVKDGYRRFHSSTPGHSLSSPWEAGRLLGKSNQASAYLPRYYATLLHSISRASNYSGLTLSNAVVAHMPLGGGCAGAMRARNRDRVGIHGWLSKFARRSVPPTTDLVPQSLHSVSQYSLRLLWKMQLYQNEHCPARKLRANGSIGASLWPLKIRGVSVPNLRAAPSYFS
jgi:hypothetical protein